MADRCLCPCHGSLPWQIAAESLDVIEAAVACDTCRDQHSWVLLVRHLWHTPSPGKAVWIDPPPSPPPAEFCAGDGPE